MQFFLPILVMWQEVKFHICYMPWPGKCILSLAKGFDKASCILGWLPLLFWPLFSICLHLQYKKIHSSTTYRFVFFLLGLIWKKKLYYIRVIARIKKIRQIISQIIYTYYTLIWRVFWVFLEGEGARVDLTNVIFSKLRLQLQYIVQWSRSKQINEVNSSEC